ncbi:uncharacterized protein LOC127587419 [Pristis pectinata]|uniref:uncharacterized protein LOC127587419 n=1 Tax=Pristis pectinata TaxID=685728 RepID=UPI00223C9BB3|nr:uncharacterized protein LOC127587419 [Pristis pectinata]
MVATYSDIKRTNWLIHSACGLVEGSARLVARAVARGTRPLLDNLEPQINIANDLAANRLDRLEERFPILKLSVDEVTSHLSVSISLTLDNVQEWIASERDRVTGRTRAAMVRAQGFVAGRVTAFLNTSLGQVLEARGARALVSFDRMVDQYLPDTEEAAGAAASGCDGQEEPGMGPQVWRLVLKVRLRWQRRALVYGQSVWLALLTNALLLYQVLDRLGSSQMLAVVWRAQQLLLWFCVARIYRLSHLQLQLQTHLAAAGRVAYSALGLAHIGRNVSLLTELLSQCAELAVLLQLFFFNALRSMLLEPEAQEESGESGDESADESADDLYQMNLWAGRRRSSRGEILLTGIDEVHMERILEEAGRRRRSLGSEQPSRGLRPGCSTRSEPQSPSHRGAREPLSGPRRASLTERILREPQAATQ